MLLCPCGGSRPILATSRQKLGFGVGIAYGFATVGRVGFEGRFDYAAIGSVTNLAARLCERAKVGEILIDSKVQVTLVGHMELQPVGKFIPRGFSRPVEVFNILTDLDHPQPLTLPVNNVQ